MGGEGLKRAAAIGVPLAAALFDALVLRQGLIAGVLGLYGTVRWYAPGKSGRWSAAACLVGALIALGVISTHFAALEKRAEKTVKAAQAFFAAQGRYPERLEELVPAHLPVVPGNVSYRKDSAGHRVEYAAYSPLFLKLRIFRLEQGKWETFVD